MGETVLAEDIVLRSGWKGANQAASAALSTAGVSMAGYLCDDAHAPCCQTRLCGPEIRTSWCD